MLWLRLHAQANMDHLGLIPSFLDPADPRPAQAQLTERYGFPCTWERERFTLDKSGGLHYPGDPVLRALWGCPMRGEVVIVYECGFVAIIPADDQANFVVARLD